jgi:four helix bundle protein
LEECRYYLILARDLNYGEVAELRNDLERVSKMLDAYMRAIRNAR